MNAETLIYVSNLPRSVNFYSTILGFRLGDLFPNKEQATYAPTYIGENKLMLVLARESNRKFYPKGLGGSGFTLFIKVNNIDELYSRIKEKVEIIEQIESKKWGDREFTIKDSDGYLISFYTPIT